ncbi:MAG: S1 RNA-binding domain-containing protein [Patescibacteria group bacterium]
MMAVKTSGTPLTDLARRDLSLISLPRVGDLVQGTVLSKSARMLVVDLGRFGTGVVYRGELKNAWQAVKALEVGGEVSAKVIDTDNEDGYIELSLAEAGRQKSWTEVMELKEKDEPFTALVKGSNKGGLTADVCGLPAFLPVSQLSTEHYPKVTNDDKTQITTALEKLIGKELTVKIIDVNPRSEKLIISEREATELSSKELSKNYTVGQEVEGIISGVADFGAFVQFTDNPSVEGLIHVSELAHRIVQNPKEIVKVDDVVRTKIVDIRDGKISLSLKALQSDPWVLAAGTYRTGEEVTGKVYMFNPYGAVVALDSNIQGQIHVTEFGGVEEMKKEIAVGKDYVFVIDQVKPEERRITLKRKK